jgi:hypothetical protein
VLVALPVETLPKLDPLARDEDDAHQRAGLVAKSMAPGPPEAHHVVAVATLGSWAAPDA